MEKGQVKLVVYGAAWCPDARRSRKLLDEHQVLYDWHDIDEEPSAKEFVEQANGGRVIVPTIVFPDGSLLVEPTNPELLQKLESIA